MTAFHFHNGAIVGADMPTLSTRNDRIVATREPNAMSVDLAGGYLLPGFIDTQVNGGGGVLFNDSPTVEGIAAIGDAHRRFGTTSFLPTLISDELDVIDAAMRATERAIESGVPGVVGIHLEGPFLNPARKGTHDAAKFRTLDSTAIRLLSGLKRGRTLVTLAPECCTPDDIVTLVRAGIVVAAGHSDADHATMARAFTAGVTGITHLYNAMSPMSHRAPGMVGAVLDNQQAWVGLIVDGHHVDPVALRIAVRARPRDRFMLVTDAMPTVGSPDKTFMLQGKPIRVQDGVCVDTAGTLSGSDLDMAGAVRNAVRMLDVSVADAVIMAASAPAAFLSLSDRGRLRPGLRADMVWLDRDLTLRGVWSGGRHEPHS